MLKDIPLGLLLVTPFKQDLISQHSCLHPSFFGNYRDGQSMNSVFTVSDPACLDFWETSLTSGHYSNLPNNEHQLVWIEEEAVDTALKAKYPSIFDSFLGRLQSSTFATESQTPAQEVISATDNHNNLAYELHYRTPTAALLSTSPNIARVIDTLLPPFWKSTLLPDTPIVHHPISSSAADHVKDILSKLKFDPVVASVVGNISIPQARNDIHFLTNEDGKSGIVSRHSFTTGARTASLWLKEQVERTGANCRLVPFLVGFAPNVICRYDAIKETTATVLVSGHYDSRGSFGSVRAPGGNDDGSGTTGVLSIAHTIARKGVRFHSNVELAFFAGEEQGLLGSRAYARELRAQNANITLMVQADMTAYRAPGEPLQLGLPDLIGSPDVTQLVANISAIYSPELQVGVTSACCSDHQSFHEQGFPATQVFERAGPIADPMYHNSGDLSTREGYDFEQLYAIAKVQFATILHTAGFELAN